MVRNYFLDFKNAQFSNLVTSYDQFTVDFIVIFLMYGNL